MESIAGRFQFWWKLGGMLLAGCLVSFSATGQEAGPANDGSSNVVGRYTVNVQPKPKTDDGYWDWYVRHVEDIQRHNKEVVEVRIQLAHLASEISRAWAMRYELSKTYLQWSAAKDESIEFAGFDLGRYFQYAVTETAKVGRQAIASNRRHFSELGNRINTWSNRQKELIDQIIHFHQEIVDRAEAQLERSGDRRPGLARIVEELDGENTMLPIFLYDYAAWYAPDQLPKLLNDFLAKEQIEPSLKNLLLAKAKIGDAQNLERKSFVERLKPSTENNQRLLFALATIKGDPLGYMAGRSTVNKILLSPSTADVYQITSQTQRLDAIALLREIVRTNPGDATAKSLLIQQELYWLKRITQKLEGQAALAKSAFSAYLTERGFSTTDRSGWIPWMADYLGAVWGLGPISLFAGVPGIDLPGANAELVGAQLMDAARARVSLVALIRLVKSGRTLAEIKALDQQGLAQVLVELWEPSTPGNKKSITRIAVDMHRTLRDLKDLDRFSTDDGDITEFARDVNEFFAKDYFVPVDSRYQSFEWFGDLLNVHNIVTLWGPGAITKVNGKWAKSGYMTFAEQDALQKAGNTLASASRKAISNILDNQNLVIAGYNLDTIGETIRTSRSAKLIAKMHAYGTKPIMKPTALSTLIGESSKLVASFYLNNAVTELAKASGIPGAALLTEILMSYEVPQGVLDHLIFDSPATPLTGMTQSLRRYQEQIESTGQQVSRTRDSIEQAENLLQEIGQETAENMPVNQLDDDLDRQVAELDEALQRQRLERLQTVAADIGADPSQLSPPSDIAAQVTVEAVPSSRAEASEQALSNALEALQQGDVDEAQRALEAAETLAMSVEESVDEASQRVSTAIDRLESASPRARTVSDAPEPTVVAGQAAVPVDTGIEIPPPGGDGAVPGRTVQAGETVSADGQPPGETVQASGQTAQAGDTVVANESGETVLAPGQTVQSGDTVLATEPAETVLAKDKPKGEDSGTGAAAVADEPDQPALAASSQSPATPETIETLSIPLGERNHVPDLIDTNLYDLGVAGEKLRLADELGLRGDDLDAALAYLDEAQKYADEMEESFELLTVVIQRRKALLANARDARALIGQFRSTFPTSEALEEISPSELEQILQKLRNGDFKSTTSGINAAIEVNIEGRIFRLKPELNIERAELDVIGGAVADLLGLDSPAAAVLDGKGITINLSDGQQLSLGRVVVSRHVDNFVPVMNLDEPTLLALRAEYADQRTLRALLADSDGHLGNIGLGPNGKLWVIDNDLANLGPNPNLRQLSSEFHSQEELVEAAVTMAHGKMPPRKRENGAVDYYLNERIKNHPLYRWIARADQMIGYKDMKPMVEKIKALMSAEEKLLEKLIARGIEPGRAREVVEVLKSRTEVLEQVLDNPTLFGSGPIKLSGVLFRQLTPWPYVLGSGRFMKCGWKYGQAA